jgi:GNAT superfamily N-acetyltransferase
VSRKPTPWDAAVFAVPTFELADAGEQTLQMAITQPGHYTVKVDPLACKKALHDYGFYYCDTLIEPYCPKAQFKAFVHAEVSISKAVTFAQVQPICHGAFAHGRFQRDFNLDRVKADLRYDNWLAALLAEDKVYGVFFRGDLAGFIAVDGNILVLHALSAAYRGQGLSKYFWTAVCQACFADLEVLKSSISATNIPALNLYASLGFQFSHPVDVYHRLTP